MAVRCKEAGVHQTFLLHSNDENGQQKLPSRLFAFFVPATAFSFIRNKLVGKKWEGENKN